MSNADKDSLFSLAFSQRKLCFLLNLFVQSITTAHSYFRDVFCLRCILVERNTLFYTQSKWYMSAFYHSVTSHAYPPPYTHLPEHEPCRPLSPPQSALGSTNYIVPSPQGQSLLASWAVWVHPCTEGQIILLKQPSFPLASVSACHVSKKMQITMYSS